MPDTPHLDDAAREQLVLDHVDLARRIAAGYVRTAPSWVEADDIVSAALHGLTDAARRFDPDAEATFATFASRRVHGEIKDAARRDDGLPRRVRTDANRLTAATDDLVADLGREPTDDEIAVALGWPVEKVDRIRAAYASALHASLDTTGATADGEPSPLAELLRSDGLDVDDLVSAREMAGMVREAIAALPMNLALTLAGLYLQEREPHDVAAQLGVSTARLRALRIEAVNALRVWLADHYDGTPAVDAAAPGVRNREALLETMRAESTVASRLEAAGDVHPMESTG